MPEEKKKESFTFSDKIKSKNASKSFAARMPSKIGSDGKPRQTLFERTKRDAPFLIAAAVALLLLPFLYKYSGHVEDGEVPMITPGYEDSIVNPDRSGFDFSGDPDGQISQLSGRDSMDLIVGFGKRRGEEEQEESLADIYRSGLADSSAASSYRRSDMDEEENITNIYRHRKNAAPQTRAAFRRAATPIGNLKPGGVNRGGGGLRVVPWGGNLKAAAQRVRGEGPRNSTKPVSLQPLQAAGKPSRSYFGQGAAKEAQRSKDAMSKGNAMQALMDAQMKPIEPGRIGGIMGGDLGGPGGGNGNLHREFAFNGKEPWWWDLMKTREQMRWEKWFNYAWGWMDWGTKIVQNLLGSLLSCWITGTDDWSVDHWYGGNSGGSSGKTECCGINEKKWKNSVKLGMAGVPFTEDGCKANIQLAAEVKYGSGATKEKCAFEWKDTKSGGSNLTRRQQRLACLGGLNASLEEVRGCDNMSNYMYQVQPGGIAKSKNWNVYHYVVARNYLPEASELHSVLKTSRNYLCEADIDLKIGGKHSSGVEAYNAPELYDGESTAGEKGKKKKSHGYDNREEKMTQDMYQIDPESREDACVIYVQRGEMFNYKNFQTTMIRRFEELLRAQGAKNGDKNKDPYNGTVEAQARRAFNQLDLMFIESFASKKALGKNSLIFGVSHHIDTLPMMYKYFKYAYVEHMRVNTDGGYYHHNVDNAKWRRYFGGVKPREMYVDYVMGQACDFDSAVSIDCNDAEQMEYARATVTFKQGYKGKPVDTWTEADFDSLAKGVSVTALYTPMASSSTLGGVSQPVKDALQVKDADGRVIPNQLEYHFKSVIDKKDERSYLVALPKGESGTILWTLSRDGEQVGSAQCKLNMSGDGTSITVEEKPCPKGPATDASCCADFAQERNLDFTWDEKNGCVLNPKRDTNDCPLGAATSAECCAKYAEEHNYNFNWTDGKCNLSPKDGNDPNPDLDPSTECKTKDDSEDCCAKFGAQDPANTYAWDGTKCNVTPKTKRTPPPPPTTASVTMFAPYIKWVPANPQGRKAVTAEDPLGASTFTSSLVKTYPHSAGSSCRGCQGRQFCDDLFGYTMDSKKATEFVTKVRDAYNTKYKDNADVLPIQFTAEYPTDGEFIDALQIAAKENLPGLDKVSTAAVCELGRDFTRMSKDKHAGGRKMIGTQGQKAEERYFHNELGAYLAYIHDTSVLYPDAYVSVDGQEVCDWRFQPKGLVFGGCPSAQGIEMGKGYAYNNYNGTRFNNLAKFKETLTPIMRDAPLKDLVKGHSDLRHDCQGNTRGCRNISGTNYVSQYNSFSGFAGLIKDQGGFGNGTACEAFAGNNTMAVADVLKYIQGVCSAGLDYKPKGMGKAEYVPGQSPTSDGGAPGTDPSN